jgi:hypothetical protein
VKAGATVLTSVLTSTVVSAIIGAFLKYSFDRRILSMGHDNQMRLAEITENLRIVHDAVLERDRQRREVLPRVAEQVYRLRNNARNLVNANVSLTSASRDFQIDVQSIETFLFQYRILLENEGLFSLLHRLKTDARTLVRLAQDQEHPDSEDMKPHLHETYRAIDQRYNEIVAKIAERVSIAGLDTLPRHQN